MIIYSHTLTTRLQYVVDFLSGYFSTPIKIICDEEKYLANTDPVKINYSFHRLSADEIWINSHVLLFETAVRSVKIECFELNDFKAFFKAEGDVGFDPLAGIFYLLTRYEEYLPHQKDEYGRYSHENSLAFKENFLHLPLVNIWLHHLKIIVEQKFPGAKLNEQGFRFLPTYDIDMAWSFRNKGFKRNSGAMVQLIAKGRIGNVAERVRVLRGKKADPYDAYQWMDQLHQEFNLTPIYFFLVAQERGKLDKNIDVETPEFQHLVLEISKKYQVGLHPSWASNERATYLPKEKHFLEQITGKHITKSRQHFIRLEMPTTYRRLITLGITDDYSMGYGSINGFRASIACTYYWYDLKNELPTKLAIHPFCFMDATSFYDQGNAHEDAFREVMQYLKIVKSYGGQMITIWHNSFLGTDPEFEGWREIYLRFIESVTSKS
ncbi:MAG: polysaccharide deacetylase family protein [Candidatus Dadabacteria bacterium]